MKPSRQMVATAGLLNAGGATMLFIGWLSYISSASRYQAGSIMVVFLGMGMLLAGVACGAGAWFRLAANVEEIGRLVVELPGAPKYLQLQDAPTPGAGGDTAGPELADGDPAEPDI